METKLLLQELKIHLIREKPLIVRGLYNGLYSVIRIEEEPINLVRVYYTTPSGTWYLDLYPGSRRLQELEDQITGVPASTFHTSEDEIEKMEVVLLRHFLNYRQSFHYIIVMEVDKPYMKLIDGKWIIGKIAWQRVEGSALSQRIYEPASNALELAPYAEIALNHCGYRNSYAEPDLRHQLTDCPPALVGYAQFLPQTGRMAISEAMKRYRRGTRIRLMECRCEYFLEEERQFLSWVSVAARCDAHASSEKTYGWLCAEQVEIVE